MTESKAQNRAIASIVVDAATNDDRLRLLRALDDLAREDPAIGIEADPNSGPVVIKGMGELHLETIRDRLLHEYKLQLNFAEPRIIYLETIRNKSEAEGKYVRVVSRIHIYGHVKLRLEPLERGSGYRFVNEITDGAVPPALVEPVNLGVQAAMKGGILAGHEMVDLRAILCDGSYHSEDSNEMAFKIAGSMAFKEAARKALPVLLEPMMTVKVTIPEDYAGIVMGDLSSRRALIVRMDALTDTQLITATVPLAEMFGYASQVRLITQGRGSYALEFSHYEEAPRGGWYGADEIGVTANKPRTPTTRSGSAADNLDPEM